MDYDEDIIGLTLDETDAIDSDDYQDEFIYEENEDEDKLKEIDSALLPYYQKAALANDLVDNIEKSRNVTLLGLQFVVEIIQESNDSLGTSKYWCAVCERRMVAYSLVSHLSTSQHQTLYVEKVFPSLHTFAKENSNPAGILKMYNKQLREVVGSAKIAVIPESDEKEVIELMKEKLAYAQHLSYYDQIKVDEEEDCANDSKDKDDVGESNKRPLIKIEDARSSKSKKPKMSSAINEEKEEEDNLKWKTNPEEPLGQQNGFTMLRFLMVGGFFEEKDLPYNARPSRIEYARHDAKMFDEDPDGLVFLKTIKKYDLSKFDVMTITPFNWITTSSSFESLGINPKMSGVKGEVEQKVALNQKIVNLLRKIKRLDREWANEYPDLAVIWMLPYPLDFSKRKIPSRSSPKHIAYKSIIQYCAILNITKKWIELMPDVGLVLLSPILIRNHQEESFFDGSCHLAWDKTETTGNFASGLSKNILLIIWKKIKNITHRLRRGQNFSDGLRSSNMKDVNIQTLKKLNFKSEISQKDIDQYAAQLESEKKKFMTIKGEELMAASVNPELYDAHWEWCHHWNNVAKPALLNPPRKVFAEKNGDRQLGEKKLKNGDGVYINGAENHKRSKWGHRNGNDEQRMNESYHDYPVDYNRDYQDPHPPRPIDQFSGPNPNPVPVPYPNYPQSGPLPTPNYPQNAPGPNPNYPAHGHGPTQNYPANGPGPSHGYPQNAPGPNQNYPQHAPGQSPYQAPNLMYLQPTPGQIVPYSAPQQYNPYVAPAPLHPQSAVETPNLYLAPAPMHPQPAVETPNPYVAPAQNYQQPHTPVENTWNNQGSSAPVPYSQQTTSQSSQVYGTNAPVGQQPHAHAEHANTLNERLGGYLPTLEAQYAQDKPQPEAPRTEVKTLSKPRYSPMCTLNILCEAKSLLGFLGSPILGLQKEAAALESQNKDPMALFDDGDPVELVNLCLGKLEKLKPDEVKDSEDQFMIDPAKNLCESLINEIKNRK